MAPHPEPPGRSGPTPGGFSSGSRTGRTDLDSRLDSPYRTTPARNRRTLMTSSLVQIYIPRSLLDIS